MGAAVVAAILAAHVPAGGLNPDDAGYVTAAAVAAAAAVVAAVVGFVLVPSSKHAPDGIDTVRPRAVI